MAKLLLFAFFLSSFLSPFQAQQRLFTPEEKAFLYHVVMKSKVLERNASDHFHYKGDSVVYGEKVDYDKIEEQIILEPSMLEVNTDALAECSPGLISEISTKMALYALHQQLMKRHEDKPEGYSDHIFEEFMDTLAKAMPSNATRIRNGELDVLPKLVDLLDPTFSMKEKVVYLRNLGGYNRHQEKKILEAYHYSVSSYVQKKGYEYYRLLGGPNTPFNNFLMAAGDGSGTSGLLGERETNEKGKKKPKGIGLFTYDTYILTNERNAEQIEVKKDPKRTIQLYGNGKTSNLHLSMWGFNSKHQTTVVVKKEGKSYLLYANKTTKELSPDSTHGGEGKTYHVQIRDVEEKVKELEEGLFGKKGFEYWKKYYFEKLEDTKMKIVECEGDLNRLRYGGTNGKKAYKKKQSELERLYSLKATYTKKLAEAEYNLKEGHNKYKEYQLLLAQMKENIGTEIMTFEKKEDVYIFNDGSVFDARTQDLRFADTQNEENIQIQLLAIGSKALNKNVDEVQLHVNLVESAPIEGIYNEIRLQLKDEFKPDAFVLDSFAFNDFEKFQLQRIAAKMGTYNTVTYASVVGNGIGKKTQTGLVASDEPQLDTYPAGTRADRERLKKSRMFMDLRSSHLHVYFQDTSVYIDIDSYTDPVKSSMHARKPIIKAHFKGKDVTGNEVLSALRSYFVFEALLDELKIQAKKALKGEELSKCNERIAKLRSNIKVSINGKMDVTYADYLKFKKEATAKSK